MWVKPDIIMTRVQPKGCKRSRASCLILPQNNQLIVDIFKSAHVRKVYKDAPGNVLASRIVAGREHDDALARRSFLRVANLPQLYW